MLHVSEIRTKTQWTSGPVTELLNVENAVYQFISVLNDPTYRINTKPNPFTH
jgi:hypothetical protein